MMTGRELLIFNLSEKIVSVFSYLSKSELNSEASEVRRILREEINLDPNKGDE